MDEEHISPLQWEEDKGKPQKKIAVRVLIEGRVQGVGYRNWLRKCALDHAVDGWARNKNDGRVEALLGGYESAVRDVISACFQGPPAAAVRTVKEFPETNLRSYSKGFIVLPTM